MMLKRRFTKNELLIMKKYPKLFTMCAYKYKIPYAVLNRAYTRYLRKVDDYILISRYPNWWFSKNKDTFCCAVHNYIAAKEHGKEYDFGTRGFVNVEMVKLSRLDKFISI